MLAGALFRQCWGSAQAPSLSAVHLQDMLVLEFSEILFPWKCSFLELASSLAGTHPFVLLMYRTDVAFQTLHFYGLE